MVAAANSRLVTRALIVFGTLGLVFAWRVDRAIKTAYESDWVAPGSDLRLPTDVWVGVHAGVGFVSVGFLALAVLLWRRRVSAGFVAGLLGKTSLWATAAVVLLAAGAAVARLVASVGGGKGSLTVVVVLDVLALGVVTSLALATGNAVYGELTTVLKRIFQRQRMNFFVVAVLVAALALIGDTSGQAIDSIRSWSPIVFGSDGADWSTPGAARLSLGLAAALLFALVVYESGVRLTQVTPALQDPGFIKFLAGGLATTVVGAVLWWLLPLGPGVLLLGIGIIVLALLDRPNLTGNPVVVVPPTVAERNAPEWLAVTSLLALAATSVAATVDAGLSGAVDKNTILSAFPAVVLSGLAILFTRRQPTRQMIEIPHRTSSVVVGVIVLISLGVLLVGAKWLAALYGLGWFAFFVVYAFSLFHHDPADVTPDWRAFAAPIALGGGLAIFFGLHVEPLKVGQLLGVFTLALVAFASVLFFLHHAVRWTLRWRPPRLLWWFGLGQLPVLTLLLLWWVGVGLLQTYVGPQSLHDVRLLDRPQVALTRAEERKSELERAFDEWVRAQPDLGESAAEGFVPLVLVAAHGGGIRAAYWTAAALDCMVGVSAENVDPESLRSEDPEVKAAARSSACSSRRRTPAEQQAAARRIFLASGVSGGAVGLYAYARQLLHHASLESENGDWIDEHLGKDFASPAVGWGLFHDVPNRLFGFHPDTGAPCEAKFRAVCLRQNRAAVLEETFDAAWKGFDSTEALLRGSYDVRFSRQAPERANARLLPLLVMNATLTGGNARAVVSGADLGSWPRADADDPERGKIGLPLAGTVEIRDALCETRDMRLSSAALLASRFPYVTPSGRIAGRCGYVGELRQADRNARCATAPEKRCEGRFVDGGYADNSGLFTLVAVWPSLRSLIVDYNVAAEAAGRREIAPMIVEIDNHYQASLLASVPSGGSAAESLIPLQTGFGSRKAIETYARAAAYRILPSSCTVTVSPSLHPGLIAPLGWELSEAARADLRAGLTRAHPADKSGMTSVRNLREIQARIAGPSERRVVIENGLDVCRPQLPEDQERG